MVTHSKFFNPETAAYLDPQTDRRVVLLTGGNSGIGWYTALHLYLHGYVVYVAGRTESKVLKAIAEIKEEAERRATKYPEAEQEKRHFGALFYIHYDACDLDTVKQCARTFLEQETQLNVLINNAGVMGVPFQLTKDGYEIQYQVNLVAPMLLTIDLSPILEQTASKTDVRVITLSSIAHQSSLKYWDPNNHIKKFPDSVFTWIRYANAKRAAIEFMKKYAEDHPNILAFSVHPGVITETELYNYWTKLPVIGAPVKIGLKGINKVAGVIPEEGALATLKTAMDASLGPEDSGSYFVTGGLKTVPSSCATKEEHIERTWAVNIANLQSKGFLESPL